MICKREKLYNGDLPYIHLWYKCDVCGKESPEEHGIVEDDDGKHYCPDCSFKNGKISERDCVRWACNGIPEDWITAYIDEDGEIQTFDPRYKDPRTKTDDDYRHSREYKEWRQLVFERDNYTCQICEQYGGALNARHIRPYRKFKKFRFDIDNGVTLCEKCHRKVHKEKLSEWLYSGK